MGVKALASGRDGLYGTWKNFLRIWAAVLSLPVNSQQLEFLERAAPGPDPPCPYACTGQGLSEQQPLFCRLSVALDQSMGSRPAI